VALYVDSEAHISDDLVFENLIVKRLGITVVIAIYGGAGGWCRGLRQLQEAFGMRGERRADILNK
jgi:hypothetical protein